jgi:hypothetical protein
VTDDFAELVPVLVFFGQTLNDEVRFDAIISGIPETFPGEVPPLVILE